MAASQKQKRTKMKCCIMLFYKSNICMHIHTKDTHERYYNGLAFPGVEREKEVSFRNKRERERKTCQRKQEA